MTLKATYKRAGLIGVGLMGTSVAMGLRRAGLVETWVGLDRDSRVIQDALRLGAIQEVTSDLHEVVREVEFLLIAAPVRTTATLIEQVSPLVDRPDFFLFDVGSTKARIVSTAEAAFLRCGRPNAFVGAHPIAGKEKTGPLVADPELFRGKTVYLTPTPHTLEHNLARVEAIWKALGADVRKVDPESHDEILAVSSHLPHMAAFALMDAVKSAYEKRQIHHSMAGGLTDMTRVVSSSSQMWSEICLDNRDNILKQIDVFQHALSSVRDLVSAGDEAALCAFFADKKQFRDMLL